MSETSRPKPLPAREAVDEYFIENRHRVLDVAAFLDRLDRSGGDWRSDYRMAALVRAIGVLAEPGAGRAQRIQMIFSDPTVEPKPKLDQKAARGAWDPASEKGA
ncbi:MAG: hypothetical protein NT029_11470 [Armatimonadetes bacterium]|nr:hypothetical protein [Armatimonadota bacterium]